jgi:hypothetical protein
MWIKKSQLSNPKAISRLSVYTPDAFDGYFDKKQIQEYPDIEDEYHYYIKLNPQI